MFAERLWVIRVQASLYEPTERNIMLFPFITTIDIERNCRKYYKYRNDLDRSRENRIIKPLKLLTHELLYPEKTIYFFHSQIAFYCRKQNYLFMYTGRYSELQPVTSKECNVYTHEGYNVKTI